MNDKRERKRCAIILRVKSAGKTEEGARKPCDSAIVHVAASGGNTAEHLCEGRFVPCWSGGDLHTGDAGGERVGQGGIGGSAG